MDEESSAGDSPRSRSTRRIDVFARYSVVQVGVSDD